MNYSIILILISLLGANVFASDYPMLHNNKEVVAELSSLYTGDITTSILRTNNFFLRVSVERPVDGGCALGQTIYKLQLPKAKPGTTIDLSGAKLVIPTKQILDILPQETINDHYKNYCGLRFTLETSHLLEVSGSVGDGWIGSRLKFNNYKDDKYTGAPFTPHISTTVNNLKSRLRYENFQINKNRDAILNLNVFLK